ncbi:Nodule Cysteine-Rich (NCR) secreted peptide [Medicago truncatula]|uniref:Nodule Cysteine-Rich (NCR) secreted peptide n=1 Tax=Medicago truncatula TaxID=3880 RepID=A0A072V8P5_MEDTR|nr:Nodule Cysteine-Rich (NCR) secreted peptide [Medicago truncatula]
MQQSLALLSMIVQGKFLIYFLGALIIFVYSLNSVTIHMFIKLSTLMLQG